jgi:hypothetical protein
MHNQEHSNKDRSWLPIIAAAIIGAVATIIGGVIANGTGALHITIAPVPAKTVTITPEPAPAATVTESSGSSGGIGSIDCLSGQDCRTWNLTVPMGNFTLNSETGIIFDLGQVLLDNSEGDMDFGSNSSGIPELSQVDAAAFSTDITAQNASKARCQTVTTSAPDANPIVDFHVGLLFCVLPSGNSGIALVEETKPLGSSNILYLKEIYWPN